jgi:hypothetical protein
MDDGQTFDIIEGIANRFFNGHFTIMSFTTNWRICFGPQPNSRMEIEGMAVGTTLADALANYLNGDK